MMRWTSPLYRRCATSWASSTSRPHQIGPIVFDIRHEENPCSLCAKLRRGALHDAARKAGCSKVALGHHFDDVVETYMLSLFYEGRISCFSPVTYLDRADITLIRPLLYVPEHYVRSFAKRHELPIVHNPCPADGNTKRQEIKDLLKSLEKTMPGVRERIFRRHAALPARGLGTRQDPPRLQMICSLYKKKGDENHDPDWLLRTTIQRAR